MVEGFCSGVLSHDPPKLASLPFTPIVSCPDCSTRSLNSCSPGWRFFFLQLMDPVGSHSPNDPPRQPDPFLVLFMVLLSTCSQPLGLMSSEGLGAVKLDWAVSPIKTSHAHHHPNVLTHPELPGVWICPNSSLLAPLRRVPSFSYRSANPGLEAGLSTGLALSTPHGSPQSDFSALFFKSPLLCRFTIKLKVRQQVRKDASLAGARMRSAGRSHSKPI